MSVTQEVLSVVPWFGPRSEVTVIGRVLSSIWCAASSKALAVCWWPFCMQSLSLRTYDWCIHRPPLFPELKRVSRPFNGILMRAFSATGRTIMHLCEILLLSFLRPSMLHSGGYRRHMIPLRAFSRWVREVKCDSTTLNTVVPLHIGSLPQLLLDNIPTDW